MYHSDEYYRSIIEARDETIYELYNDVDELRTVIELLEDDLQEANERLAEKDELIKDLNSIISNLSGEIALLKDENRELQSDVILYQRSCMDRN